MRICLVKILLTCTLAATLTSCAAQDARQMYAKASALTKLSAAVEATVLYKDPSSELTDNELLRLSTAGDSTLFQEFNSFSLRVHKASNAVIVLVCNLDGTVALLEDASCTAKLDRHHWRDSASAQCEFTLNAAETCP